VLSCAAIVALPGEAGTASEVSLAIRYGKPIVAFSADPALVRHFALSVPRVTTIDAVRQFLRRHLAGGT
jgi:predicted Rossmann-fold nucleotide-binding protein